MMKKVIYLFLCLGLFIGCEDIDKYPGADEFKPGQTKPEQKPDNQEPEKPEQPENPDTPEPGPTWNYDPVTTATIGHAGLSYIWDESVIPEITISITKDEWNNLLAAYDRNANNKE
jgi:hypothetical protein